MLLPSAIGTALDVGIKVVGARNQFGLVPKEDSLVNHKENLVGDVGLMMGRSFRVGWGPGFVLVHCGAPLGSHKKISGNPASQTTRIGGLLSPRPKPNSSASAFSVTVEKLHVASHFSQGKDVVLVSIAFKGLKIVNLFCWHQKLLLSITKPGNSSFFKDGWLRDWGSGPESIPDHPLELSLAYRFNSSAAPLRAAPYSEMMRFLACCVDVTESFCNTNPNHEPNQVVVNEGLRFKGTAYDTLWHLYKEAWISLFIFIGHAWKFWSTYCQVGFLKWILFWCCLDVHKYQVNQVIWWRNSEDWDEKF